MGTSVYIQLWGLFYIKICTSVDAPILLLFLPTSYRDWKLHSDAHNPAYTLPSFAGYTSYYYDTTTHTHTFERVYILFTSHIEASADRQAQQQQQHAAHMCAYACRPGAAAVGIEWGELIKVQPSKNIQVSRVQHFVRWRSSEQLSHSLSHRKKKTHIHTGTIIERTLLLERLRVRIVVISRITQCCFICTYCKTSRIQSLTNGLRIIHSRTVFNKDSYS